MKRCLNMAGNVPQIADVGNRKENFNNMKTMTDKNLSTADNSGNVLLMAVRLAEDVIKTLDVKSRAGCIDRSWKGHTNGNGTEIGKDIERVIKKAKRLLANCH